MSALHNRENSIRILDAIIASLLDLREDIDKQDEESLQKRLESAREGREIWLAERAKADWTRMPGERTEKTSIMESLFGSKLGKMGKRKK